MYSRAYNIYNSKTAFSIIKSGFRYQEYFEILLNLRESKETLWANLRKKDGMVSQNQKARCDKHFSKSLKDLEKSYDLFKEPYIKSNLPFPKWSVFLKIYNSLILSGNAKLLIAKFRGNYILQLYF